MKKRYKEFREMVWRDRATNRGKAYGKNKGTRTDAKKVFGGRNKIVRIERERWNVRQFFSKINFVGYQINKQTI